MKFSGNCYNNPIACAVAANGCLRTIRRLEVWMKGSAGAASFKSPSCRFPSCTEHQTLDLTQACNTGKRLKCRFSAKWIVIDART